MVKKRKIEKEKEKKKHKHKNLKQNFIQNEFQIKNKLNFEIFNYHKQQELTRMHMTPH